ncbi:MAG: hypothetical protein LBV04_07250 [Deferribacteraceae bacterium]|nr:hypothetical protein [Deferribacteraceae bacterium]
MSDKAELLAQLALINDAPDGATRIAFIEEAIHLADQLNERYHSFNLRMKLMHDATFNGQGVKAVPAFAWCVAEAEKGDSHFSMDDILWEYKWIISTLWSNSEISLTKLEELEEDFKAKVQENGYNLNSYYYMRINHGIHIGDKGIAKAAYDEWKKYPRDAMSDCRACVQDELVDYALFMDDYDEAKRFAEPLFHGKVAGMRCRTAPRATYARLLLPMYWHGDLEGAAEMEREGYKLACGNENNLHDIGKYLLYYALIHQPKKALAQYQKFIPWLYNHYANSSRQYTFSKHVAAMFAQLAKDGRNKATLHLTKEHPLYNEAGHYMLEELQEYHYSHAKEIGEKMDKRNGNTNNGNVAELDKLMTKVQDKQN